MAVRKCFILGDDLIIRIADINFKYFSGFAKTQKEKSINSLHYEIRNKYSVNVLEISSSSNSELGKSLSAFNLKLTYKDKEIPVENIFQSSKVFINGGPYIDLLFTSPSKAKKDERLKNSGELQYFYFNNYKFPLKPTTIFYDYIYCFTLYQHKELVKELINYKAFTDIEFNALKSRNCQAHSVCIFLSLFKKGIIDEALLDFSNFKKLTLDIYDNEITL